jgi:hypothetical protein
MRRGQEPGQGVYVARRLGAALVILLLLVLLVPWACENLLRSEGEPAFETSETADVDDSGDGEETVTEQGVAGGQEDAANSRSDDGEPGARGSVGMSTIGDTLVREDESDAVANIEFDVDLAGPAMHFERTVGEGEVNVIQEIPAADVGVQQAVRPPAPAEPMFLGEPVFIEDPVHFEDPVFFEDPTFEDPILFEDPIFLVEEPSHSGAAIAVGGSEGAIAGAGGAFASS